MAAHVQAQRPTARTVPGAAVTRPSVETTPVDSWSNPTYQAFRILWLGFIVAPVLFGLDKFFDAMTDWGNYLAPSLADLSPFNVHGTMLVIGVVEIVAGLLVLVRPRIGGYVVAAWLAGIIVNLLVLGDYYDVALRDFGLLLGALALARLATTFRPKLLLH